MPLILGTNSIKDTGYEVANSLRFDDGSSDYLSSASTGTNGNRKSWTLSLWFKRANLGSTQTLFSAGAGHIVEGFVRINSSDRLEFKNDYQYGGEASPTRVLKDVGSWYHLIWAVDVTQSSNDDRWKIYLNGELIPASEYSSVTINNADGAILTYSGTYASDLAIGRRERTDADYWDGYIAEAVIVEGSQLDPTSFGEFDEDSPTIWKPKDVSGLTFGTNGFYLDFENASSLGADVSGNSNNFTVNNLTSVDQSTDTCTNNFCTMNPLYPDGGITFSEGNLKLNRSSSSWRSAGGTIAVSKGKWYWETKTTGDYTFVGFADIQLFNEGCSVRESFTTGATTTGTAFSLRNNDPVIHSVSTSGGQTYLSGSYSASAFTSATIGIALNLDDNEASWYIDGTIQNSGTPLSISAGNYIPGISIYATGVELNFGSPPYSISSGNSDANGYGNFEYSVPSGYYALNSKNLAEFG